MVIFAEPMPSITHFAETQRFTQWWLWAIMTIFGAGQLIAILRLVMSGQDKSQGHSDWQGMLFGLIVTFLLILFFLVIRLVTKVTDEGIFVRFLPFHLKTRFYPWADISKCYVREYKAISEYGGWGIRGSILGKGRALTVNGNRGLQLEFTSGKKLLIGTQQADVLTTALEKSGRLTPAP